MKKYMKAVRRRLNLPKGVKDRVMTDFASSIAARKEAGETDEQIIAELGTPKEAAALLNEQMKEYTYQKSPWRWAALAAASLGGLLLMYNGVVGLLAHMLTEAINASASVGVIGGADGPTTIFVTTSPSGTGWIVWAMVTVMGLIGFWYLGHMKKK